MKCEKQKTMGKSFLWLVSLSFHQCSAFIFVLFMKTRERTLGTIKPISVLADIWKQWAVKYYYTGLFVHQKITVCLLRSPMDPIRLEARSQNYEELLLAS